MITKYYQLYNLQLGNRLDVIHAELLPEDKGRIIKEFKEEEGPTAMIGDGVNDALALATADIGISMGISGSALATETGHVILMSNDIRKIPGAIKLARKAQRKVIENVFLSICTKAAILGLAFAGHPLVWAAVLADVGTCLLVICNSMLLLRGTDHKHGKKCCKTSAGSHIDKHEHGCKTSHCHSSHGHEHGSINKKAVQEPSASQQCSSICQSDHSNIPESSSNSCGDHSEAKHCNNIEGCNMVNHKIEAQILPGNCCSGHRHEANHCHKGHNNSHRSSSCPEEDRQEMKNDHCHSSHCGENHTNVKALGNLVEHSCREASHGEPPHTAIDIPVNPDREEASHGCTSVEKREFGGCCKSYMKECCGKHGHIRPGIGGGLTEIVTE